MAYNRNRRKYPKQYKSDRPRDDGVPIPKDATRPSIEKSPDTRLTYKSNRDLPKSGSSLTVKLDPYTEILPGSDPYAVVNGINRSVGGQYGGRDNMDSGYTQQFQMSEQSKLLNAFDSFFSRAGLNYRYLPIKPTDTGRGKGFQKQMINSINEILSLFSATTFYNMAINSYVIKTDMPIGGVSEPDKWRTCLSAEGMYCVLIVYQIFLQMCAGSFNAYNKFRTNAKMMFAMSWNREVAALNSYFGLAINKASFINQWKALALTLLGEYFDKDWMEQSNIIGALTGRKANDMLDPLIEFVATHHLPKFTLAIKSGVGESATYTTILTDEMFDQIVSENMFFADTQYKTFQSIVDELALKLSVNDTLYWARALKGVSGNSDVDRFNFLSNAVTVIIDCANIFKRAMGDVRAVIDVLAKVGVNNWTKSVQLNIIKGIYAEPLYNRTLEDLYRTLAAGGDAMFFDSTTLRWTGNTQWNKYSGVPEYDSKSGGAFLSFCTKALITRGDTQSTYSTDYLPILITSMDEDTNLSRSATFYAINRKGASVALIPTVFDPTENRTTSRLVILPDVQGQFNIRAPYTPSLQNLDTNEASYLQSACLSIFGIFAAISQPTVTAATDLALNPDIVCMMSYEVEDLTEEMTTYARVNGPFKVNVDDKSNMGFLRF